MNAQRLLNQCIERGAFASFEADATSGDCGTFAIALNQYLQRHGGERLEYGILLREDDMAVYTELAQEAEIDMEAAEEIGEFPSEDELAEVYEECLMQAGADMVHVFLVHPDGTCFDAQGAHEDSDDLARAYADGPDDEIGCIVLAACPVIEDTIRAFTDWHQNPEGYLHRIEASVTTDRLLAAVREVPDAGCPTTDTRQQPRLERNG